MFLETHLKGKDPALYHYFLKYVFQNTSAAGVKDSSPLVPAEKGPVAKSIWDMNDN